MKLADFIDPNAITADLASTDKPEVLAELGGALARVCSDIGSDAIARILAEREQLATTGIGNGVAIPHGKSEALQSVRAAVGISRAGVPFDAIDGKPVYIFFALLAPLASTGDHLKALARVSRLLKEQSVRARLLGANTAQDVYDIVIEADGEHDQ
jgi:PTS system nitrogen regulatory IIA component